MGIVVLGMTLSLDGFVNDRHGDFGRLAPVPRARVTAGVHKDLDAIDQAD